MSQDDPWSVTDLDLHEQLRALRDGASSAVVATVVDVEGSAYRRPGAKLVSPAEGEAVGAITAGCLEGPVADLAADVRTSGVPRVETFDLTDDDGWGLGLGCNGVIDVLLEPLDDSFDPLLAALDERAPAAACTVVESADPDVALGARVVFDGEGAKAGDDRSALPPGVTDGLRSAAEAARDSGSTDVVSLERDDGDLAVFVDGVRPAPTLLLFGTQNDVHSVARFGREVGFEVVVASARGARADPDRFPNAHRVVSARPTELGDAAVDPERTHVVLMSHNFVDDRLALEHLLLETDVPYVGLMGPRKRFERMRDEFDDEGTTFPAGALDRVSTPVGLDLGVGGPAGIAMSVVAEALAVANGTTGGRLSERSGPIHPRSEANR